MAKFLKSFFTPEKRKNSRLEGDSEEDRSDFTPPLDGRRKLSISRSGKMRQAQKKRHSLSLDLYGENYTQHEKPKNLEYHVNTPVNTKENEKTRSKDNTAERKAKDIKRKDTKDLKHTDDVKTPEEEIEIAFEVIDKVS